MSKWEGSYWVGKVVTNYLFESGGHPLCHRRKVEWYPVQILRSEMSEVLKNACGSIATISDITKHAEEIERFISGTSTPQIIATNTDIEDPSVFARTASSKFSVSNWNNTLLGKIIKSLKKMVSL